MHKRRGSSGFGGNPISDQQIISWQERRYIRLRPWEERAILKADDAYMEFQAESSRIRSSRNK